LCSRIPPELVDVDTTLYPGKFSSASSNELKYIRVAEVKMTHYSTVFVDPTSTEDLI
jgi:hypothetical protein